MAIKDAFIVELRYESALTKKCWSGFHWIKELASKNGRAGYVQYAQKSFFSRLGF